MGSGRKIFMDLQNSNAETNFRVYPAGCPAHLKNQEITNSHLSWTAYHVPGSVLSSHNFIYLSNNSMRWFPFYRCGTWGLVTKSRGTHPGLPPKSDICTISHSYMNPQRWRHVCLNNVANWRGPSHQLSWFGWIVWESQIVISMKISNITVKVLMFTRNKVPTPIPPTEQCSQERQDLVSKSIVQLKPHGSRCCTHNGINSGCVRWEYSPRF